MKWKRPWPARGCSHSSAGRPSSQPEHLLLLLLESDPSSLRSALEKKQVVFPPLLDALSRRADALSAQPLEEGRRPLASQSLRTLLAEAFRLSETHQRLSAEPIDVLEAALTTGTNDLRNDFRKAGFTRDDIAQPTAPSSRQSRRRRRPVHARQIC